MKLSESESWIKLVTSIYCTCDLWTTLLLGGKTFPIIEAFFLGLNSGPIHSSPSLGINTICIPIHQAPTTAVTLIRSKSRPEASRQEAGSFNRKSLFIFPNYRWLLHWTPKTQPPSTPVGNCHPCLLDILQHATNNVLACGWLFTCMKLISFAVCYL